jgi:PhnB protein
MTMPSQGVIAHLSLDDAAAAIAFYEKAFGAKEVMRVSAEDGRRLMHAEITINGARVFLMDDFPEYRDAAKENVVPPRMSGATSVTLHLSVEDCDAAVERAEAAGARVTMAPHDAFWGDRYARLIDPFGHFWSLAHTIVV